MIEAVATLSKMSGLEVSPGILLIGEPSPVKGTNLMRCLADVNGALCIVELSLKFGGNGETTPMTPKEE